VKILFIGGTGNIFRLHGRGLRRGYEVFHLNRGTHRIRKARRHLLRPTSGMPKRRRPQCAGSTSIQSCSSAHSGRNMVAADIDIFDGVADPVCADKHLLGIQKAVAHPTVTEATPLENPFWEYSRLKIACERVLTGQTEDGRLAEPRGAQPQPDGPGPFPTHIVRPSHTYDDGWISRMLRLVGLWVAGACCRGWT